MTSEGVVYSDVLKSLNQKYVAAEKLMISPEGKGPLIELLPVIDNDFEVLMNACASTPAVPLEGTDVCLSDLRNQKEEFDVHVQEWLRKTDQPRETLPAERRSEQSYGGSTTSSRRSERRKSRVNLRLAILAKEHEEQKLHETRQRTRERADRKAREAREDAEREQREIEEEALRSINDKQRQLEMAEAADNAWRDEDDAPPAPSMRTAFSSPVSAVPPRPIADTARLSRSEPLTMPPGVVHETPAQVGLSPSPMQDHANPLHQAPTRVNPFFLRTAPNPTAGLVADVRREPRPPTFPTSIWPSPRFPEPYNPPLPSFEATPLTEVDLSPRPVLRTQKEYEHNHNRQQYQTTDVGERFLPRPVIEKFSGDPMGYWTFVRQFDTHITKKTQGDDLRLLYLIQHCEQNVREKISHLTSKPPHIGYRTAWNTLHEEYGQPHVIARCCEEHLKDASKVNEFDNVGLKKLSVLMDKCCTSLHDVKQSSSVDSMEVMLSVIRKLPPVLHEKWIEWSVDVERRTGNRAKFTDLSEFVCLQSTLANSIFGRAIHPSSNRTANRRTRAMACSTANPESRPTFKATNVCFLCKGCHPLDSCEKFKSQSLDERWDFVRSKKICFRCFQDSHGARHCRSQVYCDAPGCSGIYHHTLLHNPRLKELHVKQRKKITPSTEYSASVNASAVFLNVVPVKVRFKDRELNTYAFLDQGSTTTFCEQSLVDELNATGTPRRLTLQTLTSAKSLDTTSLTLSVRSLDGGEWMQLPSVVAVDTIPIKPNIVPSSRLMRRHNYLRDVELRHVKNGTVKILIGADVPQAFRVESSRSGSGQCPDAIKTPLGWSLLGPSFDATTASFACSNFISIKAEDTEVLRAAHVMFLKDESDLQPFTADTNPDESALGTSLSVEDRRTYRLMKDSVKFTDNHYELPLPWRHDYQILPDSRMMAKRRLSGLKKRLTCNPDMKIKYVNQISTMIAKGYAEVTPEEEIDTDRRAWYLPHHPVINPRKPDKLRVVFDCAAKHQGISINQVLMQGPDLVNSLVGVLTRFRREPIALVADIEAMFHQVRVTPRDRDSLRFWWWPNGDLTLEPRCHRMKVHLFGATSSPSCASFCLRQAAVDFGGEYDPSVATAVERNFYVDDCLVSVPNAEAGIRMAKDMRSILAKAGFRLTKWLSNSKEVIDSIPEEERSKSLQVRTLDDQLHERVLGINWSVNTDEFMFTVALPMKPRTRRGMLSTMNSLFDPLGFVAPIVLEARLIYRNLCQQELEWDEPVPEPELKRWEKWLASLPRLRDIVISRSFGLQAYDNMQRSQLHFFADASKIAYGAVCYLRTVDRNQNVNCTFVMGKSRLAPQNEVSIPRMELMAAVTAVNMDQMLRRELGLDLRPSIFWSDSAVVLQSLFNERRRFPLFVSRRLAMISENTCTSNWKHVPTQSNPADYASRGASADALLKTRLWFSGPDFLTLDPENWPNAFAKKEMSDHDIKQFDKKTATVFSLQVTIPATDALLSQFSSLHRVKVATAWLLRVKRFLRKRAQKLDPKFESSPLSVAELQYSETELIKYVQRQNYAQWMLGVASDKNPLKPGRKSPVFKLDPFVSDGVLRVGGRLERAPIGYEARHPAILPHTSHLTDLIITYHHSAAGHSGLNHTLNLLSQRFFVMKSTAAVRRVLNNCLPCRRRYAKPAQQLMSSLPSPRLQVEAPPFSYTGVDYFGPIMVRQGRSSVKRYGCLFTCMTTRAVHLELAKDLTADAMINALRRFIARRGAPMHIYSDNGTNLVGAERLLREAMQEWNQVQINSFLRQKDIQWSFNPPCASHMGGAWERMIRSVRRVLLSLSAQRPLTDDELQTLLLEAEAILNSRPLTPVTIDRDSELPLTPNHLLRVKPTADLPPTLTREKDCYARKRWRYVQYLAEQFWVRWSREYLRTIIARQKWHLRQKNFKSKDIVLLVDNSTPRSQWSIGKICEVYPDAHGIVRTVSVRARGLEMRRPIHKLCMIAPADDDDDDVRVPRREDDDPATMPTEVTTT
ncbi:uncharacterized protein LOC144750934 [Ciona intestinalis]